MTTSVRQSARLVSAFVVALIVAVSGWTQQPAVSAVQLRSLTLTELGSDAIYSPFGTYFAVITRSNRVRVYNAVYDELWNHRGRGQHGTGPALAFTSDEQLLIFPGHGNESRIAVVEAATGNVVQLLDGHTQEVKALALSPDNRWLVSVQYGGEAIVWRRGGDGFTRHHDLERNPQTVLAIDFAPSSDMFAISNNEDYVELFTLNGQADAADAEFAAAGELRPNQYYGNTGYIFGLDFSPNGRWLAAGVRNEITIWGFDGHEVVSTDVIPDIDEGYCYALGFTPDSRVLFAGFQASRAAAWSVVEGGDWRYESSFADRQDYVWDIAISPDGGQLATVSVTENGVAIWELEGTGAGPLVEVANLLAQATGGDAPGRAHRSILTAIAAGRIIGSLDPALFAPRGMFESAAAYEARSGGVPVAVLKSVQDDLVSAFGARMDPDRRKVSIPVQAQGTYDIDAGRYTTVFMDTPADLAIAPSEAEALYLNWQSAVVQATSLADGGQRDATVFGDYELVHPTNGKRYPLLLSEDPLSGKRFLPVVELARPIAVTADLVLEDLRLDPLFPALYRSYEQQPVGHAILRNTGDSPVEEILVTASLAKYSSEPAVAITPRALASGDRAPVDLALVLSDEIVRSGGEETLSIQISASYLSEGEAQSGQMTALVPILNRNAIRWDDDRKVGAFMTTVQSPTVMTIAGQAAADTSDAVSAALPRPLLIGMRVLEQLRSQGIAYRVDPASAYADLSQSEGAIDFLQFPSETLAYGAGDCDDLSVLYNSILEAAGVRTAFVTTPGHIFTAFAVDRRPEEIPGMLPDPGEFIVTGDRVWIPVETTVLNRGFREAWQVGARQWRAAEANRTAAIFTTEDAWRTYPPVPWEPPVRSDQSRQSKDQFASELDRYVNEAIQLMIETRNVIAPETARDHNIRGTIYARFGMLGEARGEFEQAVRIADYVPALINLASVSALGGDHDAAREMLGRADEISPDNPRILLGLAVEHLEEGQRGSARGYYDRAATLDPDLALAFPLFGPEGGDAGAARAAEGDALKEFRESAWAE